MKRGLLFGRFYGTTRRPVAAPAFSSAVVEDFVNSRVPLHAHETTHFCCIVRGEFEASVPDRKRLCPAATMLYGRHDAGEISRA